MKVSIIGAGRTRNGIGEYIGKYFHQYGAQVTSVIGTTEKSSLQASLALQRYGIKAHPYTDFDQMVSLEKPDAVVIASPAGTHYHYLLKSIDAGLHIFCEKPFVWEDRQDLSKIVEEVLERARRKKITIAMNSQWPFSIEAYEKLCGKIELQRENYFFAHLSPFSAGKTMIPEAIPHPISILYSQLGDGELTHLSFVLKGEGEMSIQFTYLFGTRKCDVSIQLIHQKTLPRDFSFGFNNRIVSRSLDLRNYEIFFNYGGKALKIVDPLQLSVKNFIEAVEKGIEPFIGPLHISHNMVLLKEIYDAFRDVEKRETWKS